MPQSQAVVSIWDRGYQLADGVYEVVAFFNRRFVDEDLHLQRLQRSLSVLAMDMPMEERALRLVMRELLRRNTLEEGNLYLQVTRGIARRNGDAGVEYRDHPFPAGVTPSLSMAIMRAKLPSDKDLSLGVPVVCAPDIRWGHCDVKSIALLPNLLAKQYGVEKSAKETFLVNAQGFVTEGSSSNAYIVDANGVLRTHPADNHILNGIRRVNILRIARELGMKVEERAFTVEEALAAREVFLSSASTHVLPVSSIDGKQIADGKAGEMSGKLLKIFREHISKQTNKIW